MPFLNHDIAAGIKIYIGFGLGKITTIMHRVEI